MEIRCKACNAEMSDREVRYYRRRRAWEDLCAKCLALTKPVESMKDFAESTGVGIEAYEEFDSEY